ncbi:NrfG protein [Rodentibacter caecimuris]|uniref:NrfG protein n=2 Tax=Rodentibacter caecimuris TaxID=1796644 RepID=A0A9X8YX43_9PAST|nr:MULTISPECIES: tetratricopeptide repeat protein [Pasteurellaceae]AOF53506.1 Flp pilus assembly protein TadD, contains TPR repeat [Pasteurellaceae bacterium NI1060]MCQ9124181.1 tetratricopeptide repeat protein [Rodentibacter heylii]MCR1837971.1 tetratricopeptide repeat protein [Pasteurella caecimuris]MCU0107443.1 tetratricopeptide repeat protein [Pasteurella caecimuris]OOF70922.1 NrfG protein [Rodentibacter heylii]
MFSKFKNVLFCVSLLFLTGCSVLLPNKGELTPENIQSREILYESTKNYSSLISLYRDVLKDNEDPMVRYKLANNYYLNGDSESSLLYLEPLLNMNNPLTEKSKILQVKNFIQLKKYNDAVSTSDSILSTSPRNGEAYNLRGIALAQLGRLKDAHTNIQKARELFIDDVTAINNLSMLSVINGDYHNAVSLLLPQYLNGIKEPRLLHNLVFALIKYGDIDYARNIIVKESLNTSPDDLIEALKKTERLSKVVAK